MGRAAVVNYWNGRKKCFFYFQNALYFLFLYYFLLTVFSSVLSSPRTSPRTFGGSPPRFFRFVPPHRIVSLHRRPCFFTACAVSLHCYFVAAPRVFVGCGRLLLLGGITCGPVPASNFGYFFWVTNSGMRPRRSFLAARTFVRISSPSYG